MAAVVEALIASGDEIGAVLAFAILALVMVRYAERANADRRDLEQKMITLLHELKGALERHVAAMERAERGRTGGDAS